MKNILCIVALATCSIASSLAADYEFRLQSVDRTDPEKLWGEFLLTNISQRPLQVFGVGTPSASLRKPAFVQFQYKPNTAWKSAGIVVLGHTAGDVVTLAPSETRALQIPLWNLTRLSATGRVGLLTSRSEERLWSDPIDPKVLSKTTPQ